MKIVISTIGRLKRSPEYDLVQGYTQQCPWEIDIQEAEVKKPLTGEELQKAEAELLITPLTDKSYLIILDEKGKDFTSREFASCLEKIIDVGKNPTFIIGGADGIHADLKGKAQLMLSFGKLTWPHKLVRVLLAEQIYRASTILKGHPYHRD